MLVRVAAVLTATDRENLHAIMKDLIATDAWGYSSGIDCCSQCPPLMMISKRVLILDRTGVRDGKRFDSS